MWGHILDASIDQNINQSMAAVGCGCVCCCGGTFILQLRFLLDMHSISTFARRGLLRQSTQQIKQCRNMATAPTSIEDRIRDLGFDLPGMPLAPKGNYMSYNITGNYVYLAGHLPQPATGDLLKGRLGENMTVEQGASAAQLCALQMIASMKAATGGDLTKIKKIVKVVGFVASTNDFTDQPKVLNGCSDLLGEVFGIEVGRHARSALGVNVLPLGVPVEIEAIVELH